MLDTAPLFTKRLLLVTGKGGIGKSLVAAALGQAAAAAGKRVLLLESAADDHLAPMFGRPALGHVETIVQPNLSVINLDPPETFREYVVKYLGQPKLFDKVFSNRVVQSFIHTIPGFAEVMMLGRLLYTAELAPAPRHDLVVFDSWASGHFLSLMTTPDAVIHSTLGGPLVKETQRVRAFLADPAKCGIVYVGVPEDLVVSECLDFLPQLRDKSPAQVLSVVMNRMPPAPSTAEAAAPAAVRPAVAYAAHRRAHAEGALAELERGLEAAGMRLPLWLLPDLGFVDEPLAPDFGPRLLAAGRSA
jgi:anion-transporting  ArsA/GET3 family ATPase